ncbi:hypothetical protein N7456_000143 [Penicillium angulare]|uniref:Signal recognition particle subunit SRP14 n=1 Tax=Penicillium angulare TaxID=116970 RepID=A0A9W9GCG8_9EURO|nr:hypothetical protein N7456_000143 [Penicillium angulare]
MAPHLSHEDFFSALTTLLEKTTGKAQGTVLLTQKPLPASEANASPSVLIRATDANSNAPNPKSADKGKITKDKSTKVKIGTVVKSEELEEFYTRYAEICKTRMTGLKKRDRKRKAKAKGGAAKTTKA